MKEGGEDEDSLSCRSGESLETSSDESSELRN